MSNTNANFEMTRILLGQEVRKRKLLRSKRQVTAACDSSPGIASLELRLI